MPLRNGLDIMMELTLMKTLVEVVRCGSFTKAASVLNVTQSAVSKRINFMEEFYGRPLVDRNGPLLVPTEAGRLVHEMASRMLALENRLAEELQKLNQRTSLRFACSRPFGMTLLPAVMKEYMAGHGNTVDIQVHFLAPTQALACIALLSTTSNSKLCPGRQKAFGICGSAVGWLGNSQ